MYFNKGENLINKLFKKFKAEAGVGTAAAKLGRTGATKRGGGAHQRWIVYNAYLCPREGASTMFCLCSMLFEHQTPEPTFSVA